MPLIDLDGINVLRSDLDANGAPTLQFMSPPQSGDVPWPMESFTLYGLEGVMKLYDHLGELLAMASRFQDLPSTDKDKVPL